MSYDQVFCSVSVFEIVISFLLSLSWRSFTYTSIVFLNPPSAEPCCP